MEAAVRGARSAGGDTAGVIIGTARSKPNEWVQTLYEEPTWSERLMKLITIGSGYVVMDGGVGTLNEFLMVWEMANKNLHKKPIILLGELVKQCVQDLKKNQWVEGVDKPALAESPKHVIELLNEAL